MSCRAENERLEQFLMAIRLKSSVIQDLQTLFDWGTMGTWNDGQLVARFLSGQDESEAAFRTLIHRHGPMVMGICRRVLGDEHAAEDAFQATFLVLVKKAGKLRDSDLLTNWLYGVALRVSRREKAKAKAARRRVSQLALSDDLTRAPCELERFELCSVIDEEIHQLPERYRLPLVLCHLEGMRHDEVAQRLGCPIGTIESRLSRARDRLRGRLARRGLAPSELAIGVALRPPAAATSLLSVSTVDATIKAVVELSSHRAQAGKSLVWSLLKRLSLLATSVHTASAASILVICVGLITFRSAPDLAGTEPTRLVAGKVEPNNVSAAESPSPKAARKVEISYQKADQRKSVLAPPLKNPKAFDPKPELPRPVRSPTALATPLLKITIDGRLDDWPDNLPRYWIRQKLLGTSFYDSETEDRTPDSDAHFMVGFDRDLSVIYLAVIVPDKSLKVHRDGRSGPAVGNFAPAFETDAVEVYIDGTFSDRRIPVPPEGLLGLNAAKMPALQYVGVPGRVAAYNDPWGANPSLIYAKVRERCTRMKYQREREITTYEWVIQAYDHFPDKPTRLSVGSRLGFDVAVVDNDTGSSLPSFSTWGKPADTFKGCDADSLGELILIEKP
jgi:RNA polymerase sigma factor (sigma-70 family)